MKRNDDDDDEIKFLALRVKSKSQLISPLSIDTGLWILLKVVSLRNGKGDIDRETELSQRSLPVCVCKCKVAQL